MIECNVLAAIKNFVLEKLQSFFRLLRVTGCQQKIIYFFTFLLLCYFLIMDTLLYREVQKMPRIRSWNETGSEIESTPTPGLYYVFNRISVKMMLLDHPALFVFTPLSNLFNDVTHFSTVFYFITADVISIIHILLALVSAKFITSDSLLHRRFGVLLFEFRNFLDAFDGIVYRAQNQQKKFSSNYGSLGHTVDAVSDVVGFSALLLACMLYLKRTSDRKTWAGKNICQADTKGYPVAMCVGSFTIQIIVGAVGWAHFVKNYEHLLSTPLRTMEQSLLQSALLKSNITWALMWIWRVISANGFNEYLLFAIFIDKLWEFLIYMQKRGIFLLIVFSLLTQLHYLDCVRALSAIGPISEAGYSS